MKDTSRVMALSLYLPNCDRKGFFKRKQVSLSKEILRTEIVCQRTDDFWYHGLRFAVDNAKKDLHLNINVEDCFLNLCYIKV